MLPEGAEARNHEVLEQVETSASTWSLRRIRNGNRPNLEGVAAEWGNKSWNVAARWVRNMSDGVKGANDASIC